ncbi:hypothetical protein AAHE18_03G242700 [Arachis hypogaea]
MRWGSWIMINEFNYGFLNKCVSVIPGYLGSSKDCGSSRLLRQGGCSSNLLAPQWVFLSMIQGQVLKSELRFSSRTGSLDSTLIEDLLKMLDENNVVAKSFRMAKEFYQQHPTKAFSIRLVKHRAADPRVYNEPIVSELAGLIIGDFDGSNTARDILVQWRNGDLKHIYETHTLYWPLQYPLLFPYGEDGYQEDIPYRCVRSRENIPKRQKVSLRKFICFRIQERENEFETILKSRRLFQQFIVDLFRVEEAMERGDVDACSIGIRIVLPSSFTGGRRYIWLEFQRYTERSHIAISDRPDLAWMYTIEFQKRGLPHAYILVWLQNVGKLQTTEIMDEVISAELPDPIRFLKLYSVVTKYMIHGPCGKLRPSSPCMRNGDCSKFYPKKFVDATGFDKDGYLIYRRRNMGITYKINGVDVDNRFVVPYNPMLLMKYQAHINLEFGPDHVTASIRNVQTQKNGGQDVDEIKQFYDCRYLAPCESAWRLFAFDIHHKWPSVQQLIFHFPGKQNLLFTDHDKIPEIIEKNKYNDTMFTTWMRANLKFPHGNQLLYFEFPNHFVYLRDSQEWVPRQKGFSIGRLIFIQVGWGEIFYLRLLLNVQRGCKSFESIRTIDGVVYDSFKAACNALGLLSDDQEFINAIKETTELSSDFQLRQLFVTLLASNSMNKPELVWRDTWRLLADDILYYRRRELQLQVYLLFVIHVPFFLSYFVELVMTEEELKVLCLIEVEKLLQMNGRSLKDYSQMPFPNQDLVSHFSNSMIMNEMNYDIDQLREEHDANLDKLTDEQKLIYERIIDTVANKRPRFFFVYGFGGTRKTFLSRLLSFCLRSEWRIILNVASSGIASLLLPNGRTAHSLFCIPIELNEEYAPMMNKLAFEALDRTFHDLMSSNVASARDIPFGGKVIVLGGDFRQVLPVIPKETRAEIVMTSINSSIIWKHCKVMWFMWLIKNLRLGKNSVLSNLDEIKEFSDWILKIGEGSCGNQKEYEIIVDIPSDLLIPLTDDPIQDIVSAIYSNIHDNYGNVSYFQECGILAPTVDIVQQINDFVVDSFPGPEKVYLSSNSICHSDCQDGIDTDWSTTDFLNQITYLVENIIGAEIVSGSNIGDKVFIPRMNLIPSDPRTPFKFQRRKFPVRLCFAMTINKSQGQTLALLYVAISRVTTRSGLKILLSNEDVEMCNLT